MKHPGDVQKTRVALEQMVQWVVPRLKTLDLEGYIASVDRARELARIGGLGDSSFFADAFMGAVGDLRELAVAALAFQRAIMQLYPDGEKAFGPAGSKGANRPDL